MFSRMPRPPRQSPCWKGRPRSFCVAVAACGGHQAALDAHLSFSTLPQEPGSLVVHEAHLEMMASPLVKCRGSRRTRTWG